MKWFYALKVFCKQHLAMDVVAGIACVWFFLAGTAAYAESQILPDKHIPESIVGDDGTIVIEKKGCDGDPDRFSGIETKNLSWRQDGALIVDATAIYGCGYIVRNPQSSIAGAQVTLAWDWRLPENGYLAGCVCYYNMQFIVPKAAGINNPTIKYQNE